MLPAAPNRVLLWTDGSDTPDRVVQLHTALSDLGGVVEVCTPQGLADELRAGAALIVLDGSRTPVEKLHVCRRLRARLVDQFVPILYLAADPASTTGVACLEAGADDWLPRPFDDEQLRHRSRLLLRLPELHRRLADKNAETVQINKRLQQLHLLIDEEREVARRVQACLTPVALPSVPGVTFAVSGRAGRTGRLGGVFYDVLQPGRDHVAWFLADAMGDGVFCCLLSQYLKSSIEVREPAAGSFRPVVPGDVLRRLNHALIEQAFASQPISMMIYLLLDLQSGTLEFARAGHPPPWLIRREGPIERLNLDGSLLGVFETSFAARSLQLHPGDRILLLSDGLDEPTQTASHYDAELLALVERHRHQPLPEAITLLEQDLAQLGTLPEDFTVLGCEYCPVTKDGHTQAHSANEGYLAGAADLCHP